MGWRRKQRGFTAIFFFGALVGPSALAIPDWIKKLGDCDFAKIVQRSESRAHLSPEDHAKLILQDIAEERKNPKPVAKPFDPAVDPETGKSFRAMGVRAALNPDELIATLPTAEGRQKARDAYETGKINLDQLHELQLICTLTDKPVQEMLDQYERTGGHYGPSSSTVIPNGLKEKILTGEPKPTKPKEVRGAHSPTILNDPAKFQILSQETNPNGTLKVKFKKWVVTPEAPTGAWSKPKTSTLAPLHWTEEDVEFAGKLTVTRGKFYKSEKREGETITFLRYQAFRVEQENYQHDEKPGAIEWEVLVTDKNEVISSYPTGN